MDWLLPNGLLLTNVHDEEGCAGSPCVIHNPSDHRMSGFKLNWRSDRGIFERICPHGVGHPDPDQFEHWASIGASAESIHGCDGCCAEVVDVPTESRLAEILRKASESPTIRRPRRRRVDDGGGVRPDPSTFLG
jgi:hypothetical protein